MNATTDAAEAPPARRKPPSRMTGEEILAELAEQAPELEAAERKVKAMRRRRLALWVAGRTVNDYRPKRVIFMALGKASKRSEALVIKQVQLAQAGKNPDGDGRHDDGDSDD